MGNHVSIDSVPLDELVSFKPPAAAPPPLKYRSNVKLWRFYATDKPLQVKSAPIESMLGGPRRVRPRRYMVIRAYRKLAYYSYTRKQHKTCLASLATVKARSKVLEQCDDHDTARADTSNASLNSYVFSAQCV